MQRIELKLELKGLRSAQWPLRGVPLAGALLRGIG
jgi:hypothetical protein